MHANAQVPLPRDDLKIEVSTVKRSRVNLRDHAGVVVPAKDKSHSQRAHTQAADAAALCWSRSTMLEFWLATTGSELTMRTVERSVCRGSFLAADADGRHLVLQNFCTPLGTYPSAVIRSGDMVSAELLDPWQLSAPLPTKPATDAKFCPLAIGNLDGNSVDEREESGTGSVQETIAAGRSQANMKYFVQRYMLFNRFDDGIKIDEEGWYSVTPEVVARHIAQRCRADLIVDAFVGVGGNAIQFAFECERVCAIDLDLSRLLLAQHNATIYGVADRIEWIHGDFMALAPSLTADVIFLSPPWGGPEYAKQSEFDIVSMMGGLDGFEIFRAAFQVAPNVAYFLPRNTSERQILQMAAELGVRVEIETCCLNGHVKGLVAYFGFEEGDGVE